jgi:DNA polymerase-3 subunit beta
MQAAILSKHLRAAACCAAAADVRYYLNGVYIEVRATETRCVATTGEIAAVLRQRVHQDAMPEVIVPNEAVKLALTRKTEVLTLTFEDGKWSLGGIFFTPVDGKFPPYRRIIPVQASGLAGHYDVQLLAAFAKLAKALGAKGTPVIRQNGEGAAQVQLVGFTEEFVGVIMPLRLFNEKRPDPGMSAWGIEEAK